MGGFGCEGATDGKLVDGRPSIPRLPSDRSLGVGFVALLLASSVLAGGARKLNLGATLGPVVLVVGFGSSPFAAALAAWRKLNLGGSLMPGTSEAG